MKYLTALHTKRLLVNFESDEAKQERDIDIATREITELFRHAEATLSFFKVKADEKASLSGAEQTVRENVQRSMARKLQGLSVTFRSSQKVMVLFHLSRNFVIHKTVEKSNMQFPGSYPVSRHPILYRNISVSYNCRKWEVERKHFSF